MTTNSWPQLESDTPRPAGRLKSTPDDFLVEELAAYEPVGEGEHLFLWVEKRDVAAEQLLRHISKTLGIPQGAIGCAGMKDRRAITRQWLSIPASHADRVTDLETDRIRVLEQRLHRNKLRTGHLAGNRFSIVVRLSHESQSATSGDTTGQSLLPQLQPSVHRLQQIGFANYFGSQRFGRDGETLQLGYDLLRGRRTPKDIPFARRRFLLKLSLSAVQSDLFNLALARRLEDRLATTVLPGDVMEVVASGGKFVVEDTSAEQIRCDSGETAITGPLFGPKMKTPAGDVALRETNLLQQAELTMEQFRHFGDLLAGTRRRYLIRPGELAVSAEPNGIRLDFTLPPGVYATTLLGELFDLSDADANVCRETPDDDG